MYYSFRPSAASGSVGPDGAYTLTTYDEGDGAVVGFHKVTIRFASALGAGPGSVERPVTSQGGAADIRVKYANVQNPLLTAEVKRGGCSVDFDLKSE